MGRQNKPSIEKPEWFDIKKYCNANSTDLMQWRQNLSDRLLTWNSITGGKNIIFPGYGEFTEFDWLINKNRSEGFKLIDHNETEVTNALPDWTSVQSTTCNEVVAISNALPENFKSTLTKKIKVNVDDISLLPKSCCLTTVNINSPLKQLLADFENWVTDTRKKHGYTEKAPITPAKMRKWHNHKVIPYMDLLIWAKLENRNLVQDYGFRNLAAWIGHDEEQTRKHTVKIVDELLYSKIMEYMSSQIK